MHRINTANKQMRNIKVEKYTNTNHKKQVLSTVKQISTSCLKKRHCFYICDIFVRFY